MFSRSLRSIRISMSSWADRVRERCASLCLPLVPATRASRNASTGPFRVVHAAPPNRIHNQGNSQPCHRFLKVPSSAIIQPRRSRRTLGSGRLMRAISFCNRMVSSIIVSKTAAIAYNTLAAYHALPLSAIHACGRCFLEPQLSQLRADVWFSSLPGLPF